MWRRTWAFSWWMSGWNEVHGTRWDTGTAPEEVHAFFAEHMAEDPEFWTREELFRNVARQCDEYGFNLEDAKYIIFDERWDPVTDFNGCTLVQDPLHPFYPCLRHDWGDVVGGGGIENDRRFRRDLIQAGMYGLKAKVWFLGVRIGWLFYLKWKK